MPESTGFGQKIHKKLVAAIGAVLFMGKNPGAVCGVFSLAVKRLFSRKPYIFNLAVPTHSNIGDQMIVFGMEKWIARYLSTYTYKEYEDAVYKDWGYFSFLKLVIKKGDYIFLRGGGSVGDWYLGYEEFIRHVLECYPSNKIVMFPQSVRFSITPEGEAEKLKTAKAYDSHPDFTLYTRDETSFAIAGEMFRRCKVRLCPDIAMFLFGRYTPAPYEREGVLLCLRTDVNEIYYGEPERRKMIAALDEKHSLFFGDTGAGHNIPPEKREEEIVKLLALFSKSRVSVTDRFHGLIASVLTGTPCVALRSADHKIISGIKWFKDLDSVFYAETIDDVPALVEQAMRCENPALPNFTSYFDKIYEELVHG